MHRKVIHVIKKLTIGSLKPGSQATYNQEEKSRTAPPQPEKKQLEIEQHGSTYKVTPVHNVTVLDSALNQKINLDYKCKKGTCGKCQINVLKGNTFITSVNDREQKKLRGKIDDGYRLACQAVFKEG
nr:2Fe-2S iron-sulfur cluster-binding protein [Thalassobacillus devorans]